MKAQVKILATCRNPELLRATTLVFDTLRVGFPTANVEVYYNGLIETVEKRFVREAAQKCGAQWIDCEHTIHHIWIERILRGSEPVWICDTDIVFWKDMELWDFGNAAMAGRYVPRFFDRFVNCITMPRLHTSLLYLNPDRIREEVEKYFGQFPDTPFNPRPNLIHPCFYPHRVGSSVKNYFHDTCSILYQAIGGDIFLPHHNDCYDHLNFGTISDVVCPYYPNYNWRQRHFAVFENPALLKGAWRTDEQFYLDNPG